MEYVLAGVALWGVLALGFVLRHRDLLWGLWREPVLSRPVLIIESDDWGAGPLEQAEGLRRLMRLLSRHQDCEGRHPKMTLGLVLAVADTRRMAEEQLAYYRRVELDKPCFKELLGVIHEGVASGVFVAQLHGMEHYWPDVLMELAKTDNKVRAWLVGQPYPLTEALPAPAQSRWINAAHLPSEPLPQSRLQEAARDETAYYQRLFPEAGIIVVPPTFIWPESLEEIWTETGVEALITPGRRYSSRDDKGKPQTGSGRLFNGQTGKSGLIYLVRNDYFEPEKGHLAGQALQALKNKTAQGRPTLLETHRFNFISPADIDNNLRQLDELLACATQEYPGVAFISPADLARIYAGRDADWIKTNFVARLRAFIYRCQGEYEIWRGLRLLGMAFLLVFALYLVNRMVVRP